jgi:hypothetical protein
MKILITNHHLKNFAGSELTTLEFAIAFKKFGHDVSVATFEFGEPLKNFFLEQNITVYNLIDESIEEQTFDLIWAHHFPVLLDLFLNHKVSTDRLVVYSMFPLISNPYETFFYFNNTALYVVHSYDNQKVKQSQGINIPLVFPNSVPADVFRTQPRPIEGLKKLAIISNHICEEVKQAIPLLNERGVEVCIYGHNHHVIKITPEILINFDAVITIGRTIQYCFALGIPVYCYDHFGGPGWINNKTLKTAEYYNFSGRCTQINKTSEQIAQEIIFDFNHTLSERDVFLEYARDNYNLEKNLQNVLDYAEKTKFHFDMDSSYKNNIINFVAIYKSLKKQYNALRDQREIDNNNFVQHINNLEKVNTELAIELSSVYNSMAWKIISLFRLGFYKRKLSKLKCVVKSKFCGA